MVDVQSHDTNYFTQRDKEDKRQIIIDNFERLSSEDYYFTILKLEIKRKDLKIKIDRVDYTCDIIKGGEIWSVNAIQNQDLVTLANYKLFTNGKVKTFQRDTLKIAVSKDPKLIRGSKSFNTKDNCEISYLVLNTESKITQIIYIRISTEQFKTLRKFYNLSDEFNFLEEE